jgi:uncharacterized membrane protein YjjP (DUF1212 family)
METTARSIEDHVRFICELARQLHMAGTAAPRLEAALNSVSARLALRAQVLSTPTSVTLTFNRADDDADALARHTQILRLDPGDVDLRQLAHVDRVAEDVASGRLDTVAGRAALRELKPRTHPLWHLAMVASFGLASGAVAVLLKGSVADVGVAALLGTAIGALAMLTPGRPHLAAGFEAIVAFLVTLVIYGVHVHLVPLSVNPVAISALIVLLPGLMLTTAVNELATQHLVSGMARLAGAGAVLLKLGFGIAAASHVAKVLGWEAPVLPAVPLPTWAEWTALGAASFAFAVLFRAARRDYLIVMASAWLGYLVTRGGGALFGAEFGVFAAGLIVCVVANLYAWRFSRPGALVRVPGVILLVPGSVGLRSLFFVFERDVYLGLDTAFSLVIVLASLVAGLLMGNMLVPPRRSLS